MTLQSCPSLVSCPFVSWDQINANLDRPHQYVLGAVSKQEAQHCERRIFWIMASFVTLRWSSVPYSALLVYGPNFRLTLRDS